MKIILHIGQSKTGTTALQSFLARNRQKLAEKGILYPDYYVMNIRSNCLNHNDFANAITNFNFQTDSSYKEYWQQFMSQAKDHDCHTMILSGESFFIGRPHPWEVDSENELYEKYKAKLQVIKELTVDHNVEIVVYLRNQNQWLESAIAHIIRYEGTFGRKFYFSDDQIVDDMHCVADYYKLVRLWNNIVSPSRFNIHEYKRERLLGNSIVKDFCERIALDTQNMSLESTLDHPNISWDKRWIEVKKQLNLDVDSKLQEEINIALINHLNNKLECIEPYRLSSQLHEKISARYKESNDELSRNYNQQENIFSDFKPEENEEQENKEEYINTFEKFKKSPIGRKIILHCMVRRLIRKTTPRLFLLCVALNKKIKAIKSSFAK